VNQCSVVRVRCPGDGELRLGKGLQRVGVERLNPCVPFQCPLRRQDRRILGLVRQELLDVSGLESTPVCRERLLRRTRHVHHLGGLPDARSAAGH
jgi:hypothetical protein